jgi:hypothetical protein
MSRLTPPGPGSGATAIGPELGGPVTVPTSLTTVVLAGSNGRCSSVGAPPPFDRHASTPYWPVPTSDRTAGIDDGIWFQVSTVLPSLARSS